MVSSHGRSVVAIPFLNNCSNSQLLIQAAAAITTTIAAEATTKSATQEREEQHRNNLRSRKPNYEERFRMSYDEHICTNSIRAPSCLGVAEHARRHHAIGTCATTNEWKCYILILASIQRRVTLRMPLSPFKDNIQTYKTWTEHETTTNTKIQPQAPALQRDYPHNSSHASWK